MKITFCGATEEVTGSNFLVEAGKVKFLVDCGLYQGGRDTEGKNWHNFPYEPSEIDFVIVTHTHIDHIGRLPLLYKKGFRGKIISTRPAAEFARPFLEDTAKIIKGEAGDGGEALFGLEEVEGACSLFEPIDYYRTVSPVNDADVKVKLYDAGHILGSAIVEIVVEGKTVIFTGDLGNPPVPILRDSDFISRADYVVMESTYGDRDHEPYDERRLRLERIIEETVVKKGVLLMPSFAMERTQEIMYELNDLVETGKVTKIPIFVDSPLAIKATKIYRGYSEYFDSEAKKIIEAGEDFFSFPGLTFTESKEESVRIERTANPKIIIAGSGMSTAGRILYHEAKYLSDPTTTLLVVGFQVRGTLGRELKEGKNKIKIMGREVEVNAKIDSIEAYSAHADQSRLKFWLSKIERPIKKVFLVHGESEAKEALKNKIQDEQGLETVIPKDQEAFEI